jgi:nucleoside-triphosphatase THEP1
VTSAGGSRRGEICVLSGERGVGKSLVCARAAERARRLGYRVAGLLTEKASVGETGDAESRQVGSLDVDSRVAVDLSTGESFSFGGRGAGAAVPTDELLPGWQLEPAAFVRGNEILATATPCDLLVIDELGPLELRCGRGWLEAFAVLASRDYGIAVVVCRPWLVDELLSRLTVSPPKVLEVTEDSRDRLPHVIIDDLVRGSEPRG